MGFRMRAGTPASWGARRRFAAPVRFAGRAARARIPGPGSKMARFPASRGRGQRRAGDRRRREAGARCRHLEHATRRASLCGRKRAELPPWLGVRIARFFAKRSPVASEGRLVSGMAVAITLRQGERRRVEGLSRQRMAVGDRRDGSGSCRRRTMVRKTRRSWSGGRPTRTPSARRQASERLGSITDSGATVALSASAPAALPVGALREGSGRVFADAARPDPGSPPMAGRNGRSATGRADVGGVQDRTC